MTNWESPLVVYGLWQGSVGGPTLPRMAFTRDNVWKLLEQSAGEFVNSNRGIIPRENTLEVSLFYSWMKPAFGGSDDAVLSHVKTLATADFLGNVSNYQTLTYKYYDWTIADLVGGNLSTGAKFAAGLRSEMVLSNTGNANTAFDQFPPQAQDLFMEMMKEDIPVGEGLIPLVSSEECAPEDECKADPPETN